MKNLLFRAIVLTISLVQLTSIAVADVGMTNEPIDIEIQCEPSYTYERADHAANGIALRNRSSGTIHLRGVPLNAKVIQALLYFNFLSAREAGPATCPILFNGNLNYGMKTADSLEPCWLTGMVGSHSYVADVTQFVIRQNHPNQDYQVVLPFSKATSTIGTNPWDPHPTVITDAHRLEGATLIIVYETDNSTGPLFIYDNLNNTMFSRSAHILLNHHPIVNTERALFTMIGADGQRGKGHDNAVSNERSYFNGQIIAGPQSPVLTTTAIDWDGGDGIPLPQLWDTHSHYVDLRGNVAQVLYRAFGNNLFDCLVPVAFVIDCK
jgi:hypothetical protein